MKAKNSMMPVNMTGYPVVRKPARNTPELVELEFARDRSVRLHYCSNTALYLTPPPRFTPIRCITL
jgi:hypothetical protein